MSAPRPLRSTVALTAALLVGVLSSATAQAAPGDLDPIFSGDGSQTTDFRFGSSEAAATVRQPDGKVVAVGTLTSSSTEDFAIARYNSDGTLDTSFSGDGKQVTDFGQEDEAAGVTLQADGKIVVVGTAFETFPDGPTDNFALARYNPNGSLDTSFSGDGKETTDFGWIEEANGVAIQADGKIVVVGCACGSGSDFLVARYNPNGSLDTSFSGDGQQTTRFGYSDFANGVAIQADGKIVAVGRAGVHQGDFAVARYNSDGTLDTSFSGDGMQTTDFGYSEFANGVALQGDGKIVAVGFTGASAPRGGGDFALIRYDASGSLDTSFSGDGRQTTDFSSSGSDRDEATGIVLQNDGRIVVVGPVGDGDFALARYDANGVLDTTFSADGTQTTDFGGVDQANGVILQPDGKIVAVGGGGDGSDFAIARYDASGSLDTSFSGDGKQTTDFPGFDRGNGVAIQADGKILAVGTTGHNAFGDDFALARYNANGTLDTTFSGDGKQTTSFNTFCCESANGVTIQADGKIVVVGRDGNGDFALARYNPSGTLDTSFSGDGKQTTDFGGGDGAATGVALQGNGKIVVVGDRLINGGGGFALARYNPNGSLDSTFSGDGKQMTDFGGLDRAHGVAIQADGKIVAVGEGGPYPTDFALARYNTNGSIDTTFSGDGKQTTDIQGGTDVAYGVVLQPDRKIVTAGVGGGGLALARYNPNGTLDPTFSSDGIQDTSFGGFVAMGAALQPDGRIVVVGRAQAGGNYDFGLARYNPNGTLDSTFSGDGKQTTDFGPFGFAAAVAIQADGKIVVAGEGLGADGTEDFAVARYLGG